jgi:hypothetical protein
MTVIYEWDCEVVASADTEYLAEGDIIEHLFGISLLDVKLASRQFPPEDGERHEIVLVRDDDDRRSWAYLADGKLPEFFYDADGKPYKRVPQRFHKEVAIT